MQAEAIIKRVCDITTRKSNLDCNIFGSTIVTIHDEDKEQL